MPGFRFDPVSNRYYRILSSRAILSNPVTPQTIKSSRISAQPAPTNSGSSGSPGASLTKPTNAASLLFHMLRREVRPCSMPQTAQRLDLQAVLRSSQLVQPPAYSLKELKLADADIRLHPASPYIAVGGSGGSPVCGFAIESQKNGCVRLNRLWQLSHATPISAIRWGGPAAPDLFAMAQMGGPSKFGELIVYRVQDEDVCWKGWARVGKVTMWTTEWDPSGASLSIGASDGAYIWNVETRRTRRLHSKRSDVFAQQYTSDGHCVLSGSRDGIIRTWDLRAPDSSARLGSHADLLQLKSAVCSLHLLESDIHLVAAGMSSQLIVFDRRLTKPIHAFREHVNECQMLRASLDESQSFVSIAGEDLRLRLYSLATWSPSPVATYGPLLHQPTVLATQLDPSRGSHCPGVWVGDLHSLSLYRLRTS